MNTTRTRLIDVLEHAEEQGGFLTRQDVDELSVVDRLHMVLVRCNAGRFTCPAQDALHFCKLVEHDGTEWVRDISFLAGDLWLLTLAELRVQRDRDECRRVLRWLRSDQRCGSRTVTVAANRICALPQNE
jgi:hypothetical protein